MKASIIATLASAALLLSSTFGRAQDYDGDRQPDPGAAVGAAIVGGVLGGLLGAAAQRRQHHDDKMDRLFGRGAAPAGFGGGRKHPDGAMAPHPGQGAHREGGKHRMPPNRNGG